MAVAQRTMACLGDRHRNTMAKEAAVADGVVLNPDEWHDHAQWWESEAGRVRRQLGVDDEKLEQAGKMFGPLGEGTVGPAYQEVLRQRHAAGERLAAQAQGIADRIRRNLRQYADAEEANRRALIAERG